MLSSKSGFGSDAKRQSLNVFELEKTLNRSSLPPTDAEIVREMFKN